MNEEKLQNIINKYKAMTPISNRVLYSLRELIVQGVLEPGTKMTEETTAEMFGVSRTPVRTAIERLTDWGYLVYVPYVGIVVRKWTLKDFSDLYHIVSELEGLAARYAAINGLPAIVERQLREHDAKLYSLKHNAPLDSDTIDLMAAQNHQFHMDLAHNCGNAWLEKVLDSPRTKLRMLRPYVLSSFFAATNEISHSDILDAIADRNPDYAEKIAKKHVLALVDSLELSPNYEAYGIPY